MKLQAVTIQFIVLMAARHSASAQLTINTNNVAADLAQKLVGDGVIISNATVTRSEIATGFFASGPSAKLGMDSGIVLTNGRARSDFRRGLFGLDGNGVTPAQTIRADADLALPGDADLAAELGLPVGQLNDAISLEFDFIPFGDSIKFNYLISSEEYTSTTVCTYYDAFAFFISGPGIAGRKNIALVPGTNTPVTIKNVNNVPGSACVANPQYYVDNRFSLDLTHEGHTTLFTAKSQVQPCQRYHLKLVIADKGDHVWDTGVFLEAGSLRSDPLRLQGTTPVNELNLPYLAEGCVPGTINITRSSKKPYAQTVSLSLAGTATPRIDVAPIPAMVTIPANDSVVSIQVIALPDAIPEGIEILKIYVGDNCSGVFSDSIEIEIRDIAILHMDTGDTINICRNSTIRLGAEPGYTNYNWTNGATLSSDIVFDPLAQPAAATTKYICTATTGSCTARDSVLVNWKSISLVDKTEIPCRNGANGSIKFGGTGWKVPVSYALNNGAFQSPNVFGNLTAGQYQAKMQDDEGCLDSISVTLIQSFPDIIVSANPAAASCSAVPDGHIEVIAGGGNGSFTYSVNGTAYQAGNILTVAEGSYTVSVKDGNDCTATLTPVIVPKINRVVVDGGDDAFICEGTSYTLQATSNAPDIRWTPAATLSVSNGLNPVTTTRSTQRYYVIAVDGTCTGIDSVLISVWPAPVANAGTEIEICYGITAHLNGSGGIRWQWTADPSFVSATDIGDPVVKPAATTTYYLQVWDGNDCQSLQPAAVTVRVTPSVKLFAGNDTVVAINQPLQLAATETNNSGVRKWEWSPATYLSSAFVAAPLANFPAPAGSVPYEYRYTVTGTTDAGCQGKDEIRIKVYQGPDIYVPSGFTPNNDGKNDQLAAFPVGIKEFRYLRVFDRWGQIVFQSRTPAKGWDGRIGATEQHTGMYIWIAEGIDYNDRALIRKGTCMLIR